MEWLIAILAALMGFALGAGWKRPEQPLYPDLVWVLRVTKQLERDLHVQFPTKVEGLSAYAQFMPEPALKQAFLGIVRTRNMLVHRLDQERLDPQARRKVAQCVKTLRNYGYLKEGS